MLQDAHEGYEYQDYLTVAIIFDELLNRREASFVINHKSFPNDKFYDLKVINTSCMCSFLSLKNSEFPIKQKTVLQSCPCKIAAPFYTHQIIL